MPQTPEPKEAPVSIVTLTLNPALDLSSSTPTVVPSHKLRCAPPTVEPGGGGINVARVCRRMGESVRLVLPIGGTVGRRIEGLLAEEGLSAHTVRVEGEARQSISVTEESSGSQYRFVLPGPALTSTDVAACVEAVLLVAASAEFLVVSGSMPDGTPENLLSSLVQALPSTKVIIDTSGSALDHAVRSKALLIKPSARELARLVGRPLATEVEVMDAAVEVFQGGSVGAVVASVGAGGAILVDQTGVTRVRAPAVEVRSAVGAGDSMVAGIVVGLRRGLPVIEAAALGVATGTAAVMTDGTELARVDDVERLQPAVAIERRS